MADKLGFTFYPKDWWTSNTFYKWDAKMRYVYLELLFEMYMSDDGWVSFEKEVVIGKLRVKLSEEEWLCIVNKFEQRICEGKSEIEYTSSTVQMRMRRIKASRENGKKGGAPSGNENAKRVENEGFVNLGNEKQPRNNLETTQKQPKTTHLKKEKEKEKEKKKGNEEINVLGDKSPTLTFENRKDSFKNSLIPHVEEYGREMIRSFFDYWTEPNKSKSRMRWEGESYFDVKRRLVTWASREKGFEKLPNNTATNHPVGAMESRVDRMKKVAETAAQLVNQRKNERNSISDN